MGRVDREVNDVAAHQVFLVTRDQVFGAGGSDDVIENRVAGGSWVKRHAGVYQTDSRPSSWEADLIAAVLAAGEKALVSHRAALLFWGMDGISSAPIEITVPFENLPIPEGVVVHRTRRPVESATVRTVPITTPDPDFYWPDRGKAVEVDGLDAHDSADRLDHDLRRQNALLDLGIELRRFSARDVRRKPAEVVEEIRRFLAF